jgi:WD40 repeat protein
MVQLGLRVNSAEFSHDGTRLVTASVDGTARVWNIVHPKSANPGANVLAWADTIQMRDDVRDGYAVTRELPPKGAPSVQLQVNESSTAKLLRTNGTASGSVHLKHNGRINSAEFSHDGRKIVTASEDKTTQIWDAETGVADGGPFRHPAGVEFARFSHDDQYWLLQGRTARPVFGMFIPAAKPFHRYATMQPFPSLTLAPMGGTL